MVDLEISFEVDIIIVKMQYNEKIYIFKEELIASYEESKILLKKFADYSTENWDSY